VEGIETVGLNGSLSIHLQTETSTSPGSGDTQACLSDYGFCFYVDRQYPMDLLI